MRTHIIKYIRHGINNRLHWREHASWRIGATRRKEGVDGRQEGCEAYVWDRTVCGDRELVVEFGFLQEESGSSCGSNVSTKRTVEETNEYIYLSLSGARSWLAHICACILLVEHQGRG